MSNIIKHKRSDVTGRAPESEMLDYGEIAVNYSAGSETLYIKNSNNQIVPVTKGVSEDRVLELINSTMNGEVDISGVILYNTNATTANFGAVTLLESVDAYRYVEVYAVTETGEMLYHKFYPSFSNKFSFVHVEYANSVFSHRFKSYTVDGNTINTTTNQGQVRMNPNNNKNTITQSGEYIGIFRVVGYK